MWLTTLALSSLMGLMGAQAQEATYEELMARGLELARERQWEQAEQVLHGAAEKSPSAFAPHLEIGKIELVLQKPRDALAAFDRARELAPDEISVYLLRSAALVALDREAEAARDLETALAKAPEEAAPRHAVALAAMGAHRPDIAAQALAPFVREPERADATLLGLYGAALTESGRYAEALALLERSLAAEPDQPATSFYLGQSYQRLGRHEEAVAAFRKGIALPPPDNIRFVLGMSESQIRLGRLDEAGRELETLLSRHPRAARGWFLIGLIEAEKKRYTEAASDFEKAITHGYRNAECYLNLGMAQASAGRREEALANLDLALERNPDLAAAYYYKGVLLLGGGEARRAVDPLERAASLEPDEPRTYLALAEAYLGLHHIPQALAAADKVTGIDDLAARAYYYKGLAYHDTDKYAEAEEAYRNAIARGADSAEVYLNLARALFALAKPEEALQSIGEALRRTPDDPEARLLKGKAHLELRQNDLALEELTLGLEKLPDDADGWFQKGIAESRTNHLSQAVTDWRRALALDPKLLAAYYRLGNALLRTGEAEEGRRFLEEFKVRSARAERREQEDAKAETAVSEALQLWGKGREREALELFEQAMAISPQNRLPYLYLSDFYLLSGQAAEAESVLLRGIEQLPEEVSLHEALLTLYEDRGERDKAEAQRKRLRELSKKRATARPSNP